MKAKEFVKERKKGGKGMGKEDRKKGRNGMGRKGIRKGVGDFKQGQYWPQDALRAAERRRSGRTEEWIDGWTAGRMD